MKNLKLFLLASLLLMSLTSFNTAYYSLTVNVSGADNNKGKIYIAIYDSEATFLKTMYRGGSTKIYGGSASLVFSGLPEGTYAVSCFHDENDNGKLDTNALGIPKEAYGFSNNASGVFGPPSFNKASFKLDATKSISLKLN